MERITWKQFALSLLLASCGGCASTGSTWTPGATLASWMPKWGSQSSTPSEQFTGSLASNSKSGALGSPKPSSSASPLSSLTNAFKWDKSATEATSKDDPTNLFTKPKTLGPEFYLELAKHKESAGDIDGAIRHCQDAVKIAPKNAIAHVALGRLFVAKGNNDAALREYKDAIKSEPRNAIAYNDLGWLQMRQGDTKLATESFRKAVEIAPTSERYRNSLASALVKANRATEAFDHLAAVYPQPVAHYNLAVMLRGNASLDEAHSHLEQAIAMDANLDNAKALLAKMNKEMGRDSEPSVSEPQRNEERVASAPHEDRAEEGKSFRPSRRQPEPTPAGEPMRENELEFPSAEERNLFTDEEPVVLPRKRS